MSVDRPRTGAAATCFDSRVAAAAIGSPATRFESPATRFDSRAAAAAMPAGPGTGRTLIGYQPAAPIRDVPSAALRAAAEAAAVALAVTDSARTTQWEPHEIELTLDELDELVPLDPSATIELTPVELAALAAAAAAHDAASAASSAAAPVAVATRSRRLATSPRSTAIAAAAPALPASVRPAYRCPPRTPRPGLFIGCLAASALLILLYALYVLHALAQASAHGT